MRCWTVQEGNMSQNSMQCYKVISTSDIGTQTFHKQTFKFSS